MIAEQVDNLVAAIPDRFSLSDISPEFLATLIAAVYEAPTIMKPVKDTLTDRLLDLTVLQAIKQSSFYGKLYRNIPSNTTIGIRQIVDLPIIDRRTVQKAGNKICSRYATYAFSSYTSGATSGHPLILD